MDKVKSGEILDVVWRLEKIAVDFHGKRILKKEFMDSFLNVLLQLVVLLINFKVQDK